MGSCDWWRDKTTLHMSSWQRWDLNPGLSDSQPLCSLKSLWLYYTLSPMRNSKNMGLGSGTKCFPFTSKCSETGLQAFYQSSVGKLLVNNHILWLEFCRWITHWKINWCSATAERSSCESGSPWLEPHFFHELNKWPRPWRVSLCNRGIKPLLPYLTGLL